MGSQNHIYSKKKLIKWKQGQGEGGGGCSPAIMLAAGRGKGWGKLPGLGGCSGSGIWFWRGCGVENLPVEQGSTK